MIYNNFEAKHTDISSKMKPAVYASSMVIVPNDEVKEVIV